MGDFEEVNLSINMFFLRVLCVLRGFDRIVSKIAEGPCFFFTTEDTEV
jgi:hypothetical protein